MEAILLERNWSQGHTYEAYRSKIDHLLSQNKTSGNDQSEGRIEYTRANVSRMDRMYAHFELHPDWQNLKLKPHAFGVLVIAEAWCGDAAHTLPSIVRLVEANSSFMELRIVFRDEHEDLINAYLTNGSKSIPKVIVFDSTTFEERFVWGPRPKQAQDLVLEHKIRHDFDKNRMTAALYKWYNHDKGLVIQEEWISQLKQLEHLPV
jgi:hypothetical protein